VKADCVCGCGLFGTPSKTGHIKARCKCPSCTGRKNRAKGHRKQAVAQRALGVESGKFAHTHEENWSDELFATEVKAGGQTRTVETFWHRHEAQIIANRPDFGARHRASRIVAMPDGWNDGIVMVRLSDWNTIIRPALEAAT
jgi:hypothetical protein